MKSTAVDPQLPSISLDSPLFAYETGKEVNRPLHICKKNIMKSITKFAKVALSCNDLLKVTAKTESILKPHPTFAVGNIRHKQTRTYANWKCLAQTDTNLHEMEMLLRTRNILHSKIKLNPSN